MKAFPVAAGFALALALGACSGNPAEEIENSIRAELANKTNVDQVEMNTQSDGNMTGFALTHDNAGNKSRFQCAASPTGGTKYKWECQPQIDADTERYMQNTISAELAKQGEVVEVVMKRQGDDNHMAGSAQVRTASGTVVNFTCTAERKDATFAWNCAPAEAAAPAATDDNGGEE